MITPGKSSTRTRLKPNAQTGTSEKGRLDGQRRRKEDEGWIKLDPPVPKELAIATGSTQSLFKGLEKKIRWLSCCC